MPRAKRRRSGWRDLGEFMARTCTTAIHVKQAALLEDTVLDVKAAETDKAIAKKAIFALARAEYANAEDLREKCGEMKSQI
ncbi:MAG: hypothetical protein WC340_12490 [Kiritimatiellia bacterium]